MTNGYLQSLVVAMALIVSMATSVPVNDSLLSTIDSLVAYSEPANKSTLLNDASEAPSGPSNSTLFLNTSESTIDSIEATSTGLVFEQTDEQTQTTQTTEATTNAATTEIDESDFAEIKQTDEYADDRGFFETDHRVIHQPMTNHLGHGRAYVPNEIHGLIWEEQHYMLSVLIPITCGIIGAFLIVCVAYGLRNCNTDNSNQHRHVAQAIRHRARSLRSERRRPRVDHTLLLGNSSDEENGRR